jgi:hypothetical protein
MQSVTITITNVLICTLLSAFVSEPCSEPHAKQIRSTQINKLSDLTAV